MNNPIINEESQRDGITLGSLFDGAGTFPFAAQQCGVKALWASEIEPFPIAVTKKRFPEMKHLGDITKINGAEIEPVDIITFGSPCQDLSVAGKRAGLDGERSGLFMEAVRIIKEMRLKTNGKYPTIAIWENVPGAFSSNKGEDFRVVLEELCKIKGGNTVIPRPPKRNGKPAWNDAVLILGDGFSIAWRVLDAEFWGVPQRRRRIFLVADFGGQCAGQVLFEREGLSRNFAESRETWKGITRSLACCPDKSNAKSVISLENHPGDSRVKVINEGVTQTLNSRMGTGGNNVPLVLIVENDNNAQFLVVSGVDTYNQKLTNDVTMPIRASSSDFDKVPCFILGKGTRPHNKDEAQVWKETQIANTLNVNDIGESRANEIIVMATLQGGAEIAKDICPTITAAAIKLDLRRFTPTECCRLQGMPDWWCEDVPHSDSAEYKLWGNGMAFPNVLYVMEGVVSLLLTRRITQ